MFTCINPEDRFRLLRNKETCVQYLICLGNDVSYNQYSCSEEVTVKVGHSDSFWKLMKERQKESEFTKAFQWHSSQKQHCICF